uniref:Prolyl 4-hydroxylase alpha subunit Fe(2+) 2OG dioxygenase domain-containing protein n=1 Tax=viral metagenome TaxID=1070528 RepID=A0A6C0HC31_9ZZZZ
MTTIKEYPNILPNILCHDIIKYFNHENVNTFLIPKNNSKWNKTEIMLYKMLLTHINNFKKELLQELNNSEVCDIFSALNTKIFLDNFKMIKLSAMDTETFLNNYEKTNNRYNLLTFIFYLNDVSNGGEIIYKNDTIIKPEKGKLVIFADNLPNMYKCKLPLSDSQYIITGQITEVIS